jgi:hypothetical protein
VYQLFSLTGYLGVWATAVHGMYKSIWFDGFLFWMSLVESSFPTDTGGKDPFMWIAKPSTFVKYVIKFVEENVKNNKQNKYFASISNPKFKL